MNYTKNLYVSIIKCIRQYELLIIVNQYCIYILTETLEVQFIDSRENVIKFIRIQINEHLAAIHLVI